MLQLMMKQCFGHNGKPDLDKMKDFMERHDCADRLDTMAWALFFIWVGVAWLAGFNLGVGLLGVAIITFGEQIVRRYYDLGVEGFWVIIGMGFLIGGIWNLIDIDKSIVPLFLIAAGIWLLSWGRRTKRTIFSLRHRCQVMHSKKSDKDKTE